MKIRIQSLAIITLTFLGFAVLPKTQGVVPPPDGGYPGFNTAEGQNALFSLTTGSGNTAVGWHSIFSATTASFNTSLGAGSLALNSADENTAIGTAALLLNTAGGNTAVGSRALLNNTTGGTLENIQGVDVGPNVAVGWQALESNTVASANTAVGYQALHSFTSGPMGFEQVGLSTAVGFQALANATGTFANSAFGYQVLTNNTEGGGNTAVGSGALFNNTTGSSNVAIGNNALSNNTTGDSNVALGFNAGASVTTASNVISIGAFGENVSNSCYIGNIFGSTASGGSAVFVNSLGKLGTSTSSQRFKQQITPMDKASEALFALEPVTFRYKNEIDPAGTSQFGLVAEDVEKVNPDLVVRDKEGKPYSVRYDQVNAMLLNEFLKEHKRVAELNSKLAEHEEVIARQQKEFQTTVARQDKQIRALIATVEKQAAQIQRVSAQIEVSKAPLQLTAAENP